jgi:hypothetical protein
MFKITTGHKLFQLVYGIFPLMPTKNLLPTSNSHFDQDFPPLVFSLVKWQNWNIWMKLAKKQQIGKVQSSETQHYGLNKTTKSRFFLWGT